MSVAPNVQPLSAATRRRTSPLMRREIKWGLVFLSPWLIGLIAFTALPILASFGISFMYYDPIHPEAIHFAGLDNYARLLTDPNFLKSAKVTLSFALLGVPLSIILPLGAALLVNAKYLFGKKVFRTLFYLPTMIPVVVSVMVWGGILNSDSGWLNRILDSVFGIQGPAWFQDEAWVVPAIVIMGIWGIGGTMIIMLAGLQGVPTELYESATIDGASTVQKFRSITLPMISPVIFYNLVLAVIGAFQTFVPGYIIGNGRGDPNGATMFYNLYLYMSGWQFHEMGYAATLAVVMFIIVLILTIILFQSQRRWVYYAGGD